MLDEKSDGFGGSNESVRAVNKGKRTLESLMRQRTKQEKLNDFQRKSRSRR